MNNTSLADYQRTMGLHLRAPARHAIPAGQDARRTAVYSGLVMNNIESCLATVLPVCKAALGPRWPRLVRAFCQSWRSHSPLLHELSGEFVRWLMQSPPTMALPPWLTALAHYEWAELAVEVMETEPIPAWAPMQAEAWPPDAPVVVNPALLALHYDWPVHRIGHAYRPRKPQPTCLLVYRDATDQVCFEQVNAPTLRLVALLTPSPDQPHGQALPTPRQACEQVASEMGRVGDADLLLAGLAQISALLRTHALIPVTPLIRAS